MAEAYELMRKTYPTLFSGKYTAEFIKNVRANIGSTDTGVANEVLGADYFTTFKQWDGLLRVFRVVDMEKRGLRYRTNIATGSITTGFAAIGETDSVSTYNKGDFVATEGKVTPKMYYMRTDASSLSLVVNELDRGNVVNIWDEMLKINQEVLTNSIITDMTYAAGYNRTGKELTSIDVLFSNNAEIGIDATIGADEVDVYGFDRDAGAGPTDAIVLHNSDTDRAVTTDLLTDAFVQIMDNTKGELGERPPRPDIILTGNDTLRALEVFAAGDRRYAGAYATLRDNGFNGISLQPDTTGVEGAFHITTFNGAAIVTDIHIPKDTKSRIYVTHMEDLALALPVAPKVFINGPLKGDIPPSATGIDLTEAVEALWFGEVYIPRMYRSAKIRDLK